MSFLPTLLSRKENSTLWQAGQDNAKAASGGVVAMQGVYAAIWNNGFYRRHSLTTRWWRGRKNGFARHCSPLLSGCHGKVSRVNPHRYVLYIWPFFRPFFTGGYWPRKCLVWIQSKAPWYCLASCYVWMTLPGVVAEALFHFPHCSKHTNCRLEMFGGKYSQGNVQHVTMKHISRVNQKYTSSCLSLH